MLRHIALLAVLVLLGAPAGAANWTAWRSGTESNSAPCGNNLLKPGGTCWLSFDTAGDLPTLHAEGCSIALKSTGSSYTVNVYREGSIDDPVRLPDQTGEWGDVILTQTARGAVGIQYQTLDFEVDSGSGFVGAECTR